MLVLVVIIAVLGGVVFLMTWDIPPPTATVERTIPHDQFPK